MISKKHFLRSKYSYTNARLQWWYNKGKHISIYFHRSNSKLTFIVTFCKKLTFAIILSVSFQYHHIFSLARLTPVCWHGVITSPVAQQNSPLTIWNPPRAPLSINCNLKKRKTLCYTSDGWTIIIILSLAVCTRRNG